MAINRTLPTANADSAAITLPSRTGTYLEAYALPVFQGNQIGADEGSYFVCNNATLGTAITGHAAPVIADTDTKPFIGLFNGTTKRVYLDYVFLEVVTAGTNGTIQYTTIYLDNKGATARTGGGTQITSFASSNSAGGTATTGLELYVGAVVQSMTSSVKVGQQIVREVIPVAQDTITMKFGGPNSGVHSALTTAGTATNHSIQHFAPIVVSPGGNLNISQIRASQTVAATYQFSLGFWLR